MVVASLKNKTIQNIKIICLKKLTCSDANALTIPPCEYDCKVENKKISRFRSKRSEACYLIR